MASPKRQMGVELRRRAVLALRDSGFSYSEIGEVLGVTPIRVRQVQQGAERRRREKSAEERIYSLSGEDLLAASVCDLPLPARTKLALTRRDVSTIRDLISYTEQELMGMKHFGRNGLRKVREVLKLLGLECKAPEKIDE